MECQSIFPNISSIPWFYCISFDHRCQPILKAKIAVAALFMIIGKLLILPTAHWKQFSGKCLWAAECICLRCTASKIAFYCGTCTKFQSSAKLLATIDCPKKRHNILLIGNFTGNNQFGYRHLTLRKTLKIKSISQRKCFANTQFTFSRKSRR